jgi:glycosyltransferase involved in cell wall biosynthesis
MQLKADSAMLETVSLTTEAMSVLMVIGAYLPWIGGTERQLAALAAELRARQFRVEVVTGRHDPCWPVQEEIDGSRVHRLSYPRVRFLGALILLLRAGFFLLTEGRQFQVFHVHAINSLAVLATIIGKLLGKAVVLKAVGAWELDEGVLNPVRHRQFLYRWQLAILKQADAWVAVSEHLRGAMIAAGVPPCRIVIIPNGVDIVHFTPQENSARKETLPQVIFVGRLVKEKGLPMLLQAWVTVRQRAKDAVLHIVGGGPLEVELQTLADRLGIAASVCFHGYQQAVLPFLQSSRLFVLSSYVEGLSNTLLEAMAVGLPVVATRISGSEDVVVVGESGLLVPPGDAEALAEAIVSILSDPVRAAAMGQRGRQLVEQRCELAHITDNYVQLYARIVKDGARSCAASPVL